MPMPLNYAIVDEVDSVLVDDCRNPFLISTGAGTAKGNIKVATDVSCSSSSSSACVPHIATSCSADSLECVSMHSYPKNCKFTQKFITALLL